MLLPDLHHISFLVQAWPWMWPSAEGLLSKFPVSLQFPWKTFYFLFIYFFKLFIFTLFYFIIPYWFCHILTWIHHGCACDPKHEPPSHLPPHNIPMGYPRAPAPSMLYPALDIDWWFDSYMIAYMFQCHSPKSSHPLPLPLSPKVCYTHLCLFCCLAYRVVIAIFLNSIYMC